MISIINYKLGNLGSIINMLQYLSIPAQIVDRPEQLKNAERIILPGVGAFDAGMESLRSNGWVNALDYKILEEKVPVLGICLGMQLMTCSSEEGSSEGLKYINGKTLRISPPAGSRLKVPHMGWAGVVEHKADVFETGLFPGSRFYFAHTYGVTLDKPGDQWLSAEYGGTFCAGYRSENIIGVQFHPEKSHKYGLDFFKKFYFDFLK